MTIPNLTSAKLEQLLELHARKEALQAELVTLENEIERVYGGRISPATPEGGRRRKQRGSPQTGGGKKRRGALKEMILERLGSVGAEGIKVKDLAQDIGVNRKNVEIWFYTTGKKTAGIKKLGPGLFTLSSRNGKTSRGAAETAAIAPETPRRRGVGKRSRTRGSTKERVVAALQAAGPEGISIKELSTQLGVKNQNLHTWFNQTGKKIPQITKVSLGRYTMAAE